jgi:hypothetical protein
MVADRSPIPAVTGPPRRPADLTRADVRWLNWHEASTHALVSREVRDLGDGYLLHDESDREPFWNRLGGVAWPRDPAAFDRRLSEMLALFAGLDRIPHVWPSAGYDEPPDLIERLEAFGFEDHGGGMLMAMDPGRATLRLNALRQRFPVDVAHGEEHPSGDLVRPIDRDDARVRQMRGCARLAQEPLAHVGISGEVGRQGLDRDGTVEVPISPEKDDAHAAATDLALDVVLPGKSGCEIG